MAKEKYKRLFQTFAQFQHINQATDEETKYMLMLALTKQCLH